MKIEVDELETRNYSLDISTAGSAKAGSIPSNKLGYLRELDVNNTISGTQVTLRGYDESETEKGGTVTTKFLSIQVAGDNSEHFDYDGTKSLQDDIYLTADTAPSVIETNMSVGLR